MTCAVVFLPVFWECDTQAVFSEREALVQWQNLRILQCRVAWNQEIVKAELRCCKKNRIYFQESFLGRRRATCRGSRTESCSRLESRTCARVS